MGVTRFVNELNKYEIPVKYFTKVIPDHELKFTGDWVDVRVLGEPKYLTTDMTFESVEQYGVLGEPMFEIKEGMLVKIPLGFALQLPAGYEAIVKPRSSLSKNTGLIFATSGVIDEGYCGNNDQWFAVLYATRDCSLYYGERICQFRIQEKQPELSFKKVETLDAPDRGGHGSTGRF